MGRREEEVRPLTWEIVFTPKAVKTFGALPRSVQRRFRTAIDALRDDPLRPRPGVDIKPLTGEAPLYRLRVGRFRGIYEVYLLIQDRRIVFTHFDHRKRAYR